MQDKHFYLMLSWKILGGKITLALLLVFLLIWQADPAGPLWKDVAIAALSIITALASIAFTMFMTRIKKVEEAAEAAKASAIEAREDFLKTMKEQGDRQDKRHHSNLKVLVAMFQAIKTGDSRDLDLDQLFSE